MKRTNQSVIAEINQNKYMDKYKLTQFLESMVLMDYLTYDDLLPLIKKGTAKMLGESEGTIFKEESCEHDQSRYALGNRKVFCGQCDKRID